MDVVQGEAAVSRNACFGLEGALERKITEQTYDRGRYLPDNLYYAVRPFTISETWWARQGPGQHYPS